METKMSHEVETMAWAHAVPWHGLGVQVPGDATPEQIGKAAGLNWTVSKRPLAVPVAPAEDDPEGEFSYLEVKGHKALTRDSDGKVFDVVGDRWCPVQNSEVLSFFKGFCDAGKATMETAGALKGGEIVWALANLGDGFKLPGGDAVKGYLMLASRHRSGFATVARVTPVRVVCANTLALAGGFGKAGAVEARFNHTSEFNPEAAAEAMGLAHETMTAFEQSARLLQKLNLSREDALAILAPVYQPELIAHHGSGDPVSDATVYGLRPDADDKANRTVKGIMDAALTGAGASGNWTGWDLLNGVTYYANHKARGTQDSRFVSATLGDSNNRANRVMTRLLELAD